MWFVNMYSLLLLLIYVYNVEFLFMLKNFFRYPCL